MLKMGWMVKKNNFSFLTALNWSKCILMVSLYIWLSIYTNNETHLKSQPQPTESFRENLRLKHRSSLVVI